VESLQGLPGIDTELLGQGPAGPVEGHQCISLSTRPVQGQHQLAPEALPERRPNDQRLQLAHDLGVAPGLQVTLQSQLERAQTELLQPSDLGLGERCVGQVLERGPPEQREGLAEDLSRSPLVPGCEDQLRPIEEGLEALQVELAVLDLQ
jgi:hypothetical protein